MRRNRIVSFIQRLERVGCACELVRIEQADGDFVVGVCREAVVIPEVRGDRLGKVLHQAMNFFLRWFRAIGRVVAGHA